MPLQWNLLRCNTTAVDELKLPQGGELPHEKAGIILPYICGMRLGSGHRFCIA